MHIVRRLLVAVVCLSSLSFAEQLTFKRAIELALRNSTTSAIADADQKKAKWGYYEMRNQFLPQVTVGAGLAYSHGFPLSLEGAAPSIFNVNSSSYLINFAGKNFLNAAKTEWGAADKSTQDKRAQVILDTALTYAELDKYASTLQILEQQQQAAVRAELVANDRFKAGVDPEVELTKARLNAARVRVNTANVRGNADLLRLKLSQLTGLPVDSIQTVTESIPELPETSTADTNKVVEQHPLVQSANDIAAGKALRAQGEHKAKLPSVDFAAQYAVLSRFNNYDQFFLKFERHNASVGVVIRFPFLNFAQDARAQAADAEALRAKKEADATKAQVASDTLRLQRTVDQLAAARDVAKLEYQLATSDARAILLRVNAGQATIRDQENARLVEQQKYSAFIDAQFELERAQMTLMRQTGELEKWVGVQ